MDALKIAVSVLLWVPVAILKVGLVVFGLVLVPFVSATEGIWRAGTGRPTTYWERAIRNPVGGFDYLIRHPASTRTFGSIVEPTKEVMKFQWRFRRAGILCSLRLVWQYSQKKYGELYLGWKLESDPKKKRLDFALSLRPWADVGN